MPADVDAQLRLVPREAQEPRDTKADGCPVSFVPEDDGREPVRLRSTDSLASPTPRHVRTVWTPEVRADAQKVHQDVIDHHAGWLGHAALRELGKVLSDEIKSAARHYRPIVGPFRAYASAYARTRVQEFLAEHGPACLRAERQDQDARAAAIAAGQKGIGAYLVALRARVAALQRTYRNRWHVPESAPEDVREEAVVEALAAFRTVDGFAKYERPGVEASFQLISDTVGRMRLRRLVAFAVTADDLARLRCPTPSPEAILLAQERTDRIVTLAKETRAGASRIKLKWLDGIEHDIEEHGRLRLARVADRLNRGKPAASNAREHLRELLEGSGYKEIIEE